MNVNIILISILLIPLTKFLINPFYLSLTLLTFNFLVIFNMNMLINNFWFSYISFLILIGGLMILFMYFTSISPNILHKSYKKIWMILFFILLMKLNHSHTYSPSINSTNKIYFFEFNQMSIYNNMNWYLSMFFICYLLIMLILVIKWNLKFKKPIRSFNKYE
uniref:NADH dehydrogenase subunit 6 n=1 Tax=Prosevania sp. ZJUH_2016031 TaxID=2491170 RepID=A0A3S8V1D5_9HYME|nr:NADH dehydrogenase subunit 6 [Prosevania sp. ZJUH_2016031]